MNQPVFIKHSFSHLLALFLPSWQIWQMFSYHMAWVGLLLLLYVLTLKPSFHGEPVPLLSWCCFNISLPIKLVLHQVTMASSFCTHPPNSGEEERLTSFVEAQNFLSPCQSASRQAHYLLRIRHQKSTNKFYCVLLLEELFLFMMLLLTSSLL